MQLIEKLADRIVDVGYGRVIRLDDQFAVALWKYRFGKRNEKNVKDVIDKSRDRMK